MIIKFDHISYSCGMEDKKEVFERFARQYEVLFEEINLRNISGKQKLFYEKHQYHDLVMFDSKENFPVELTVYDRCRTKEPGLALENNKIVIKTADRKETGFFFEKMGFVPQGNVMVLKTVLNKQKVVLQIEETENEYNQKLDNYGFSSLAFWSNNVEKERKKLKELGYGVTLIEELVVNQKKLYICFVVGKQGEIVELIGIK